MAGILPSYLTPATTTPGVPSTFNAKISPSSEITIVQQLPGLEWSGPSHTARQNSAAFSQASDSTTLYHCLFPKCTGEFQDDISLECHMMSHFEEDHMTDPGCCRVKVELEHDKGIGRSPGLDSKSRLWAPVDGQSPYVAALPCVLGWDNVEFAEAYLSPTCPSKSITSPSCLSDWSPNPPPIYDHHADLSLEADSGSRACQYTEEETLLPSKKRKRNSEYADSAYGSSIEPEEKLVKQRPKVGQARGLAKTLIMTSRGLRQEVDSPNPLAETSAGLETSIRVVSPDYVRHSNTIPLPFGHPKSRDWRQILPSIKVRMQAILGSGNGGAIELFCVDKLPTICVTCWDPSKVNHKILATCMRPLDLPIVITKGRIRKSIGGQCYNSDDRASGGSSRFREAKPPMHSHYMRRPDCGASLGVSEGPLSPFKVTLGGYINLKYIDRDEWVPYAMTVHHVLVEDGPTYQGSSDECNDDDEDTIEPDYDYAPGVNEGVFGGAGDLTKEITFSSPARPDLKDLISRLESRVAKCCRDEQYAKIDNAEELSSQLKELRHTHCTSFGRAAWSSGLTLAEGVEMDWLLIDRIPTRRIGRNRSGDAAAFMEGSNGNIDGSWQNWTPSDYVDETAFETLMEFTGCEWDEKDPSNYGFMSRVFGRGSESGLADGFLSPNSSVFYDPKYGSYDGWAFCPRTECGLGYSGDSGTWIYNSEGKLLGQIISYNMERHITYFTPICKAFKHIKYVTGASEVELLTQHDTVVAPRTAYGLLSPEEKSPNSS